MIIRLLFVASFILAYTASAQAQPRLGDLLERIDDHPRIRAAEAEVDIYHGRKEELSS